MGARKTPTLIALFLTLALPALGDEDPTKERDYFAPTHHELKHVETTNGAVIAIVEKMTGPCYVIHGGHGGKVGIAIGLRVFEKDILITDEMSRLHVRYKDGTYVELGASTQYQAHRVRFKPQNLLPSNTAQDELEESYFVFDHGIARITAPDVNSLERFSIRTPSSMVKISGPADFYIVQLEGDRDLTVRVAKGKVEAMNMVTNEVMQVKERMGAFVKVSGAVTSAGQFTDEQLNFLKSRTRI
jgi:hypothetical protein